MIESIFTISLIVLSITILLCIIRSVVGPSFGDRLISINVIGTKTIVLISIVSIILKEEFFIDVVLVYALISFIASVVISEVIAKSRRKRLWKRF